MRNTEDRLVGRKLAADLARICHQTGRKAFFVNGNHDPTVSNTNHLDLEAINALNIALQRYQGTVLLVTHDHDLIDEVATRIWHFETDHKITDFKGPYEEYQNAQVKSMV